MKIYLSLLIFCCLLFSCKNNKPSVHPNNLNDSTQFYPISDFINEQISFVELRDFEIHLKKQIDGTIDSSIISMDDFKNIANQFINKDISSPPLQQKFTESVFHDLSTGSFTLNYRAKETDEAIQNIDVLLFENTKTVKRIFILSQKQKNDSSFLEHHNWTANKNFQITRTINTNNGYTSNEILEVYWMKKKNSSRK